MEVRVEPAVEAILVFNKLFECLQLLLIDGVKLEDDVCLPNLSLLEDAGEAVVLKGLLVGLRLRVFCDVVANIGRLFNEFAPLLFNLGDAHVEEQKLGFDR